MKSNKLKLQQRKGVVVDIALASIKGKYMSVRFGKSPDESYPVNRFFENTSYWVYATENCQLSYGGATWELKKGWNLVGWR